MPEARPRHTCSRIPDKDMPDFVSEETRKFALCETAFLCLVKGEQRKCVDASSSRAKSRTHFSSPGQSYKHHRTTRLNAGKLSNVDQRKLPTPQTDQTQRRQLSSIDNNNDGSHPHNLELRPLRRTKVAGIQDRGAVPGRGHGGLLVPVRNG